jgi:Zn-dependent protease with chaperone function
MLLPWLLFDKVGKLDNKQSMVKRVNHITDKLIKQAIILRPKTKNGQCFELMSTHPAPEIRQKALRKMVPQMIAFYLSAKE